MARLLEDNCLAECSKFIEFFFSRSATKPKPEPVKPKLPEKNEKVKPRGKKNLVQVTEMFF